MPEKLRYDTQKMSREQRGNMAYINVQLYVIDVFRCPLYRISQEVQMRGVS